jgi:hypothetical protein
MKGKAVPLALLFQQPARFIVMPAQAGIQLQH